MYGWDTSSESYEDMYERVLEGKHDAAFSIDHEYMWHVDGKTGKRTRIISPLPAAIARYHAQGFINGSSELMESFNAYLTKLSKDRVTMTLPKPVSIPSGKTVAEFLASY